MLNSSDTNSTNLCTSFGPSGRSKVIRNEIGGSLIVTKDGQQLLECYISNPLIEDKLTICLLNMCCNVSKHYGDGSMSTLIIMNQMINSFINSSEKSVNKNSNRILLLNALEILIHTIKTSKNTIINHMIDKSIWTSTTETEFNTEIITQQIIGFWNTILLPATNAATAVNLSAILVSDIFISNY